MAKTSKKIGKKNRKENISRRSLFYSICVFALFQFLLIPLQRRSYVIFWTVGAGGYLIILLELFYSRLTDKPIKLRFSAVKKRIWAKHFLRHLILPTLLYFSGILFLFFNRVKLLDQIAIIIVCSSFWLLFYNISMTYLKAYRTSSKTKYIFDVIRIIIFYFVTDVLINTVFYYGVSPMLIYAGVFLLALVLINMSIVIADQLDMRTLLFSILSAVSVSIVLWFVMSLVLFNIAVLSLVLTVYFYLLVSFWHHKLEGTFNWDIMTQYILFALMAVILLLYL